VFYLSRRIAVRSCFADPSGKSPEETMIILPGFATNFTDTTQIVDPPTFVR
jgi:hypothetical protein